MKEILILSEDKNWKAEISLLLKKGIDQSKLKWINVSTRSDFISELSIRTYDALVINSKQSIRNLEIIFKYLATSELIYTPIIFISENFEDFKELLAQTQFPQLHFFALPVSNEIIVNDIIATLYPVQVEKKAESDLSLNLEFLKTFIHSTKYILEAFCQIPNITHSKPYLYKSTNAFKYAIKGKILLKSTFFDGEFIIGFSAEAYLKIVENVIGTKYAEISEDNQDFAGEIVNMIYGQAKSILNLSGYNFEKVIPTYKTNPEIILSKKPVVVVPLESNIGRIEILIIINKLEK